MKKIVFILSFCVIFFISCIAGGDIFGPAHKEHVVGNYYLFAIDAIENSCLTYHERTDRDNHWWGKFVGGGNWGGIVIDPTVFAVGFNEDYLIAKQCIFSNKNLGKYSYQNAIQRINYYVLPLEEGGMNWRTMNGLLGPFTFQEFEEKRKELGISDISFSVEEPAISEWVREQECPSSKESLPGVVYSFGSEFL